MKRSLSVCLSCDFNVRGEMKRGFPVFLYVVDSNVRNEMKRSLPVCLTLIPI